MENNHDVYKIAAHEAPVQSAAFHSNIERALRMNIFFGLQSYGNVLVVF